MLLISVKRKYKMDQSTETINCVWSKEFFKYGKEVLNRSTEQEAISVTIAAEKCQLYLLGIRFTKTVDREAL